MGQDVLTSAFSEAVEMPGGGIGFLHPGVFQADFIAQHTE